VKITELNYVGNGQYEITFNPDSDSEEFLFRMLNECAIDFSSPSRVKAKSWLHSGGKDGPPTLTVRTMLGGPRN